ncbi:MAG TPA: FkbM family methyltransferase [Xanthobacteraceae bacterium]
MDLAWNRNPEFTKWVVRTRLLTEPFVVIDVGVQGGESARWQPLGDCLIIHGFDPIDEVVKHLAQARVRNRYYHCMAIGDADGEQAFYFNPANPTASSMYHQSKGRFDVDVRQERRMVPIRRLDTLLAQGSIPPADYVKIDVEGFEKEALLGARELLRGGVLAIQTETSFGVSPSYPKSHFAEVAEIALANHLLVFDLAFNRIPRASFQRALVRKGLEPVAEQDAVGRPATVDVLFARDLIEEVDHANHYQSLPPAVSISQLLKLMIICELHGLNDVALDTAERFADRLGGRLDLDRVFRLLADPNCRGDIADRLRAQKRAYEESTSWRITAPLRWTRLLFRAPRQGRAIENR